MAKRILDGSVLDQIEEKMKVTDSDASTWIGATDPARGVGSIKRIDLSNVDESDRFRLRQPPYPDLERLAEQISAQGQSTPIFVRPKNDGRFELISGYRRCAALRLLRAPAAIARVYENLSDSDAYDLAVSENQDREALTEIERADVCVRLQESGRTAQQIAAQMGWSNERQAQRYLKLGKTASRVLRDGLQQRKLTMAQAMVFLDEDAGSLEEDAQRDIIGAATEHEMSANELRAFVRRKKKAASSGQLDSNSGGEAEESLIRELKNGAFALSARFDPKKPEDLTRAISALQEALRRARILLRRAEKEAEMVGDGNRTAQGDIDVGLAS